MQSIQQKTMKAVIIESFGGPETIKISQIPTPQPEPREVQIQIAFAAVNPVDWKIRQGLLEKRLPHKFPLIPGWDASGIVSAVGDQVKNFQPGDSVIAYCKKPVIQYGTYAEYVCVNADVVASKPANLSFAQAAAIPLAGLTAWQSLFDAAGLKKGETVLIQAGAGGVGSLAIQFAKHAGAYIITTASESKHDYVIGLGADIAIDYRKEPVQEAVKKAVPAGLDVIFDTIGGETAKQSYALLKPGGRIVSLLEQPDIALEEKYNVKALYVFVQPNGQELQHISDLIQDGLVQPIQIQEMPLDKAAEAQEENRQGHVQGKIVLQVNDSFI